ncbi:MAG TPA: hypothetical protein V6C69_05495 [Trichormus sp.]
MLSFIDHYPYENEPTADHVEQLEGFAAPGQTATMSVSLNTQMESLSVSVDSAALADGAKVIPQECMQLYVVKQWEQAGVGIYQRDRLVVRELLLKDDEECLNDGYSAKVKHWKHLIKPFDLYDAPDVRLDGAVRTTVGKRQPKQLWVSIDVPSDQAPGEYVGTLQFNSGTNQTLRVRLMVHAFTLAEPRQDRLIWYRGSLNWRSRQYFIEPEVMYKQFQDIFDHGFNSISLWDSDNRLLQQSLDMLIEIGFTGHVVFMQPYPDRLDQLRLGPLTPVYYVSDELDVKLDYPTEDPVPLIERHKSNSLRADKVGAKKFASLLTDSFVSRLENKNDIGHRPDFVSLFMPTARDSFFCQSELPPPQRITTYYYWHSHMEKPNVHRVLAGLYLWKSGMDGISPFCYQFMPIYPFSPFNDFDEWMPGLQVGGDKGAFKDPMTTYPARHGSIRTLQWEGLREGIIDLKYITTLHNALQHYERSGADMAEVAEIRERMAAILKRIDLREIDVLSNTEMEPYATISPREYDQFRRQMAMDILHINQLNARSQLVETGSAGQH